ncbi:MAG: fumarylacetoacetase [Verrucomicrobia bacterium]|nr:fumarylacetoacetase [Verrucomicrobiota bacterium]
MTAELNITHDPARRSWIDTACVPGADFPLQNLPFGVFSTADQSTARIGVAIGDQVLDLGSAAASGLLPSGGAEAARAECLNPLMAAGPEVWSALRARLSELLGADSNAARNTRDLVRRHLVRMKDVTMHLPARVGGYTDFYASIHHATNVGALFRPDQPLLPNYKWVPIGYHGRTSTLVPSGTPVRRPKGQVKPPASSAPAYGPTRSLDYELELAAYIGVGNPSGSTLSVADARRSLFGVSLLNDWSARDVQAWEYQPLGPFLAKNFATSLSAWVVTFDALAPFRTPAYRRPAEDPTPLPHLLDPADQAEGGLEVTLEVGLVTPAMRRDGLSAHRLSSGSFSSMYWTFAQMAAHHASNGCELRPGDVLGSGTVSGPDRSSQGCLLELTRRGAEPVLLPNGESRAFLEDGDEIILRGHAERPGFVRIGLGECRGTVLPALP